MKPLFLFTLMNLVLQTYSQAQDCLGMTFKQGMNFELSLFNSKDKPIGKIQYQIKNVHKEGGSTVLDIVAQFEDEKGNQRPPNQIQYTCTGSELIADLSGAMLSMPNMGAKNMEMKMKSNKLIYPGKLSVGQKLSDGQMDAEMLSNGSRMMEMIMTMTNRQVESTNLVTTPAGTFDTYKVTSDMNIESRVMGIPVRNQLHVVSFRAPNQLFDIKSETYNKNGKSMGYTLLSKVN